MKLTFGKLRARFGDTDNIQFHKIPECHFTHTNQEEKRIESGKQFVEKSRKWKRSNELRRRNNHVKNTIYNCSIANILFHFSVLKQMKIKWVKMCIHDAKDRDADRKEEKINPNEMKEMKMNMMANCCSYTKCS